MVGWVHTRHDTHTRIHIHIHTDVCRAYGRIGIYVICMYIYIRIDGRSRKKIGSYSKNEARPIEVYIYILYINTYNII